MHRTPEIYDVVLQPGRYLIGGRDWRMQTLPGPGVAITLCARVRPARWRIFGRTPTAAAQPARRAR